jgi:ADP-ribose pyrophosphatase
MNTGDRPSVIADGRFLRFMKAGSWEYISRKGVTGVVTIIAVTRDRKLLLVEQYRPPVESRVIELPAGLAGDGKHRHETLEAAARRELLEETGYDASEMTYIGGGTASAGLTDELVSLFFATGLNKTGAGLGDGDEDIVLHEVPVDQLPQWIEQKAGEGLLIDLKVYSALHFASNRGAK